MEFQYASLDGKGAVTNANVNGSSAAFATGTLTLTGNIADGEIVTIGNKVYTFQDTLTDVDGNVHIGASASDTLDNLIDAINLGAGAGTDYATSTRLHPDVSAAAGAGDTMDIDAKIAGVAAHSIATTTDAADGSWGAGVLGSGVDPAFFHIGTDDSMSINSLVIFIRDATVDDGDFGAVTALTNGVPIYVKSGSTVVKDLTAGQPITTNRDFRKISPKVEVASGGTWIQVYIPLDAEIDLPIGTDLVIAIQDDLTGLDEFYIYATGIG